MQESLLQIWDQQLTGFALRLHMCLANMHHRYYQPKRSLPYLGPVLN